jgi:7-cyano-7-deazaguanine synthase
MKEKKAVIILSGGIDSTTCLAYAKDQGYECYTLGFNYGQKQIAELLAAKKISQNLGAKKHEIATFSLVSLEGSALTDPNLQVPDYKNEEKIPITYVPARNTIFLSMALGWAEVLGADTIFIGVNSVDYSHYPDCRPEFIQAFQRTANLATKTAVEGSPIAIMTPLIHFTKAEIITLGLKLGVDYSMTISCYQANDEGFACGRCDSCHHRKKGFFEALVPDPTRYIMSSY